jgi:hypothetical protein
MSLADHRGTVYARLRFFQMVQQDIDEGKGEIKPVRILYARVAPLSSASRDGDPTRSDERAQ